MAGVTNEKGETNVRHYDADAISRQIRARQQACEISREANLLIRRNEPGVCGVLQRVLKMLRDAGTQSGHGSKG